MTEDLSKLMSVLNTFQTEMRKLGINPKIIECEMSFDDYCQLKSDYSAYMKEFLSPDDIKLWGINLAVTTEFGRVSQATDPKQELPTFSYSFVYQYPPAPNP